MVDTREESRREVAERIAYKYLDKTFGSQKLANDIEAALRDRDERAAKSAESHSSVCLHCGTALIIAAAIRNGDTNVK